MPIVFAILFLFSCSSFAQYIDSEIPSRNQYYYNETPERNKYTYSEIPPRNQYYYNKTPKRNKYTYSETPEKSKIFSTDLSLEYAKVDYNMVTTADSILKWRDSKGFGTNIQENIHFGKNFKLMINHIYTKLSGGKMSDYDMENAYDYGLGAFSEATRMTGKYEAYGINFSQKINNNFSLISGLEMKSLKLNPKNVYQLYVNETNSEASIGYDPEESQNTNVKMYGVNLGVDYNKKMENHEYGATFVAFVPFRYESLQYNWGYQNTNGWDWKASSERPTQGSVGFSAKLYNRFVISKEEDVWLNVYTFLDTVKIKDAKEIDRKQNNEKLVGNIKNAKLTRMGVGIGLSL